MKDGGGALNVLQKFWVAILQGIIKVKMWLVSVWGTEASVWSTGKLLSLRNRLSIFRTSQALILIIHNALSSTMLGSTFCLGKIASINCLSSNPNLHRRLTFHFYANSQKHGLFVIGLRYSILECSINRAHWGALGSAILILSPCLVTWTLAMCQENHWKRPLRMLPSSSFFSLIALS